MGDENYKHFTELSYQLTAISAKMLGVSKAVEMLYISPIPAVIQALRTAGYNVNEPDSKDKYKAYFDSLDIIGRKIGALRMELAMKEAEFNELKKEFTGEKVSEKYFTDTLTALSKFIGFKVKEKDTTVAEFCSMVTMMKGSTRGK